MPNVFISYVRDNASMVDRLAKELRRRGVNVWLDREDIKPGMRWQDAIRQAIETGDFFIACFSTEFVERSMERRRSFVHTEIGLAIEILQQMPANQVWFIPVKLSECEVPDLSIGGGQTLRYLQWEPLYEDWEKGVNRILEAMGIGFLPELVYIPAGEFLMGDDKRPTYVDAFYIGKYFVTKVQYAAFRPQHEYLPSQRDHPVVNVSWHDAVAYCDWLSEQTGRHFRLPTEEEWEKASRGTDGRIWPWGDTFDASKCNSRESGIRGTTPVGKYSQAGGDSPYGVADMAGNVWEWCQTKWHSNYEREPDDAPGGDAPRVVRGGSYLKNEGLVRCAYRDGFSPVVRNRLNGFRLVLVPPRNP